MSRAIKKYWLGFSGGSMDYKYSSTGSFRNGIPKVNPKGCFVWFIIVIITIGIIALFAYRFNLK
jgi:hypothetical protein